MESPAHSARASARALKTIRTLVRRYLDPGKPWSSADEAAMWALLREFPACADHYRQATATHRMLVGADPEVPSGFEQRRRMEATIEASGATPAQDGLPANRWRMIGAGLLTAAFAAVLVPVLLTPAGEGEWLRARGLGDTGLPQRAVGLGVAGVTDDAVEYEVIATNAVYAEDYLRLSYTNEREDLAYLFVFGIQSEQPIGEQVSWITPIPGERQSLSVDFGRLLAVPFEVHVGARHVAGPLVIVAVFTRSPLLLEDVAQALDGSDLGQLPSDDALLELLRDSGRLQLSSGTVIQTLKTTVMPGSQDKAAP
ncbi:MAG: hypothetical protein ACI9MR_000789 [Myxococcota bacterium]|jgi:hypothetical protein